MAPDKTIAARQLEGRKKDKTRITISLACNADGSDKLPLFFIGHANKPQCFGKKTGEQLGYYYCSNKKAWMTGLFFQEWLGKLENRTAKQGRKILLLLLDNAPSHVKENLSLKHVTVMFLPPKTTSKVQPMDAGIIAAFKRRYRNLQLEEALSRDEVGEKDIYKANQLQGMQWSVQAWQQIEERSIANCWKHCGILSQRGQDGWPVELDPMGRGSASSDGSATAMGEKVEDGLGKQLHDKMAMLRVRDPIDISFLLNLINEEEIHEEFTDEELLRMAEEISDAESEGSDEEDTTQILSAEILLSALRLVIMKLAEDPVANSHHITKFRSLQWKARIDQEKRKVQADIRSYLK